MADTSDFTRLIPGFDFLQGLTKTAGASLPNIGQWVAPTLNPEELEKRIEELRTVQFWLEQNARMLGATIQALEVQRMTLATLKSMNVPLAGLRESLTIAVPGLAAGIGKTGAAPTDKPGEKVNKKAGKPAQAASPAVDPMQWWGALSQQFSELAAKAMKDGAADASTASGKAAAAPDAVAGQQVKTGARKAAPAKSAAGKGRAR